jgi:hypothetical protein
MTLDICVPLFHKNLDQFLAKDAQGVFKGTLLDIEETTEVPFRLLVMVDGGMRDDFAVLEAYLTGAEYEWKIIHERQPVYFSKTMSELLTAATAKHVAIIPSNIHIEDQNWYGKMQLVFMRDPHAMVVYANQDQPNSLPPHKLHHHDHPEEPMMLITRYLAQHITVESAKVSAPEWAAMVSNQVLTIGGTRWAAPGVRRFILGGVSHGRRASKKARA